MNNPTYIRMMAARARAAQNDEIIRLAYAEQRARKARSGLVGGRHGRVIQFSSTHCRHCNVEFTPLWEGLILFCSYQCDEAYCAHALQDLGSGSIQSMMSLLHTSDAPEMTKRGKAVGA